MKFHCTPAGILAIDVGIWQLAGVAFYQGFLFELHREFLYLGFRGHNARVAFIEGCCIRV
jgi:hypothetical protein